MNVGSVSYRANERFLSEHIESVCSTADEVTVTESVVLGDSVFGSSDYAGVNLRLYISVSSEAARCFTRHKFWERLCVHC